MGNCQPHSSSTTLFCLVLSLVSLLGHSHFGRDDGGHLDSIPEWSPTEWGPQSIEKDDIIHNALLGDKYGGDMVLPEGFNYTDARTEPNAEMIFTRYDYSSIMHYSNNAFSRQPSRIQPW